MNQHESPVSGKHFVHPLVKKIIVFILMFIVLVFVIVHHIFKKSKDNQIQEIPKASFAFKRSAPTLKDEKESKTFPDPLEEMEKDTELERSRLIVTEKAKQQEEYEKLLKMRMVAPTTVFSSGDKNSNDQQKNNGSSSQKNPMGDVNSEFLASQSATPPPTVHATKIAHPESTLLQGTMIWATLEPRINTDLPSEIRAITSEDIYSADGSRLLLPRGSGLLGQYVNSIAQGQERIFVIWKRVIRPDFIDVQLNSYGTDPLGTAGMEADHVNRHFFEQFGQAILLSMISAGASNLGVSSENQFNSASAYREALSHSFADSAQRSLKNTAAISPTLFKNQGQKISVYVSRDLDFSSALSSRART